MIKMIAFDLVGVLVSEKDIELTEVENKLERMFGPNLNDSDFITLASKLTNKDIIKITEELIFKLYKIRESNLFEKIKTKFPKVKIIIATNHVSYVREYLEKEFDSNFLDDIVISAEINKIKPDKEYYKYILNRYDLLPNELLFLDDNIDNVITAKSIGINTIKVDKNTVLSEEVLRFLEDNK